MFGKNKKQANDARPQENIPGYLHISHAVIADLAGYAAMTCYGVVGMANIPHSETTLLTTPFSTTKKGIRVEEKGSKVFVELHVIIDAGTKLASVSKNLKDGVEFILKECAQIKNCEVRVVVEGIKEQSVLA